MQVLGRTPKEKSFSSMSAFWQGKSVRLRAVELDDWKYFVEWDSDIEFSQFTDEVLFPDSQERTKKWIAELATTEPWKHEFRLMIENLEGLCVGTINSHTCNPRVGTFQYGIYVAVEHQHKGFATEAIRLLLTYFFHELRYQKVNVTIHAFNEGSLVLHKKLGFQEEGRLRRMVFAKGEFHDEVILGMTTEEFSRWQEAA
jgi:RimJ/RimL family protein N-acetyltransferase